MKSFRATLTISYWRTHKTDISAHQALHFLPKKYINSGKLPVSANELLPVYLRLPQAERELKKKKELKK